MRVILVRHGQTEWNLQNRIQGWMDSPLTAGAIENTQQMSLPNLINPVIFCSDLGRAKQTADIVTTDLNAELVVDDRLRERGFGILEGCVIDQDPELYYEWMAYRARYHEKMDDVVGVETEEELEDRISSFISMVKSDYADCDIILISHGEWLRAFQNITQHQPSWHKGGGIVDNTTPLELVWPESERNENKTWHQPELPC